VIGYTDGSVRLLDVNNGKLIRQFEPLSKVLEGFEYPPANGARNLPTASVIGLHWTTKPVKVMFIMRL
jgi:hypothetical protein